MKSLPTRSDFGIDGFLDVESAWEHFGGLSQEEAFVLFKSNPTYYEEDLMWMDSPAFLFYFPIAIRYLTSDEAKGDDSTLSDVASLLGFRIEDAGVESMRGLSAEISALCEYVIANYDRFEVNVEVYGNVKGEYENLKRQFGQITASD